MNTLIKRFAAAFLFSAAVLVSAPALANASTGPWSWSDISGYLTVQTNRPVWAMAYAGGNWFYTDGQDLWNGGQVYRFDGSTQVNITTDVRNAGINRVDDIVTDGTTVLFLKNIAARNNTFEAVSYNGSYANLTSDLRQHFNSDEGLVSVVGKGGSWGIVTSRGRVMLYTPNSTFRLVRDFPSSYQQIPYVMSHVSVGDEAAHLTMSLQAQGNGWILTRYENGVRFEHIDMNGSVTVISNNTSLTNVDTMASNGSTVLIGGTGASGNFTTYTFDGSNFRDVSSAASSLSSNFYSWKNTLTVWDGSSWMLVHGKEIGRFDGSSFQSYGKTNDYFVTDASNGSGTILLGGAMSDQNNSQPTNPLTAKLVKIVNDGGTSSNTTSNGSFGGGRTVTSSNGPTVTTSGNPSNFRVGNGGTFDYLVSASDSNGVNRIDLYVNGALIKTCYATTCEFDAQYFTNGQSTRAVPFYARAADNNGNITDTSSQQDSLTVDQSSTTAGTNTNTTTNTQNQTTVNGVSYWSWVEPNQTTIRRDQTMTYNVGTWSQNGIKRVELFANGNSRRVCDLGKAFGNQTCGVTLYGGDYNLNTTVAINAKITDGNDQVVWVPVQNLTVTDIGSTTNTNTNTNGDLSVWTWLDPSGSTLNRTASTSFRVQSSASQGLNRVEVYVNGNLRRTCDFSRVYGTQNCDLSIYGGDYNAGSQLSLNAKATDYNGKTTWSDNKSVNVVDTNTTTNTQNNTNNDTQSWIWSTPETNTIATDANATFSLGAYDPNGIQKIEMYINGSIANTCNLGTAYGNQTCSTVVTGSAYSAGSNVFVNARITDGSGNIAWSNSRTYSIVVASGSTNTNTSNTNAATWIWSVPETSTLHTGESTVFHVGAWDNDGIQRIDVWINGQVKQTCNLGNAYGNQECSVTVNAKDYNSGTNVFVNASLVDGKGQVTWSGSRTYAIPASNGTVSNTTDFPVNLPGNISVTSNHDNGFSGSDTVTVTASANDQNGIKRIDLLVNGAIVKTCDGQSTCSYTGGPYQARTSLAYGANLVDSNGYALWTGYKTIYKK